MKFWSLCCLSKMSMGQTPPARSLGTNNFVGVGAYKEGNFGVGHGESRLQGFLYH